MKIESSVFSLAINNTRFWAIFTSHSNVFALKVNISVAWPCVSAISDNNCVAVVGVIYCRLDVVKICRAIVINGDYSCLAHCREQTNKGKNQFVHLNILLKFHFSGYFTANMGEKQVKSKKVKREK
jgi:hypothetical protein